MNHKATVIGLGGMGQQMLAADGEASWLRDHKCVGSRSWRNADNGREISGHPSSRTAVCRRSAIPTRTSCTSPVHTIAHRAIAIVALDAGKAVYCEKPLGVDVNDSRALVKHAQASGCVNIVNFSLATTAATREAEAWLAEGRAGEVVGIDIRIRFAQWPRTWQMGAVDWLNKRAEGGFTREVISHWVYLTERFFGRAALEDSWVRYPEGDGAETHLHATLRIGTLPVSVVGSIGGVGKDQVEYTIWGSVASCRITDWHLFSVSDGGDWELGQTDITNLGPKDHARHLSNAAAAVAGESHSMPDFADALSVQVLVEGMLSD